MKVPNSKIMLVGSDNPTTWIIYNHLISTFGLCRAIIEQPVSRSVLIRNRMRKLGLLRVLDQIAFVLLLRPVLARMVRRRITEISQDSGLEPAEPMTGAIQRVASINSDEAIALMKEAGPAVVVVNGTRILKPRTLAEVDAVFINTHQGMTPRYRGAHGAYWALHQNDAEHCGVTVHVVDEGIDTGAVISQARISATAKDNFASYPYLQTAAALPLLTAAVLAGTEGTLSTQLVEGPSAMWYHPGFFEYLWATRRGIF